MSWPSMFWIHFYDIVDILRHQDKVTGNYTVDMNDLTRLTNDIYYAGLFGSAKQKHQYTNARLNMDYVKAIFTIFTHGYHLHKTNAISAYTLYRVTSDGTVARFKNQSIQDNQSHLEFVFHTSVKRHQMRRDNPTDLRYEQHEGLEPQEVFEAMLSRKGWAHMSFRINDGLEYYILAVKPKEKQAHAKTM